MHPEYKRVAVLRYSAYETLGLNGFYAHQGILYRILSLSLIRGSRLYSLSFYDGDSMRSAEIDGHESIYISKMNLANKPLHELLNLQSA